MLKSYDRPKAQSGLVPQLRLALVLDSMLAKLLVLEQQLAQARNSQLTLAKLLVIQVTQAVTPSNAQG
jgi:hypothetical protein